MGYYISFGNRIYIFSTPSDIFNTSIGNVGPNYLSGLTIPIVFILWNRGNLGHWTFYEAALGKPEGSERDQAINRIKSNRRFYGGMLALMSLSQITMGAIFYYHLGYIPYLFIGFLFVTIFSVAAVWYSGKINLDSLVMHGFNILGIMLCAKGAVLRVIGDHLLLIRRDGHHVIADLNCKPITVLLAP